MNGIELLVLGTGLILIAISGRSIRMELTAKFEMLLLPFNSYTIVL